MEGEEARNESDFSVVAVTEREILELENTGFVTGDKKEVKKCRSGRGNGKRMSLG